MILTLMVMLEIIEGGTDMPLSAGKRRKSAQVSRINGVNVEIAGRQVM